MIHRLPLGLASLFGFSIYVALAPSACETANRAVLPIHWAGKAVAFVSDNINSANNGQERSTANVTFDKTAGYVRDSLLVIGQGKAYCTSYEDYLHANAPAYIESPAAKPNFVVNPSK